jgi:acetylornithine deacetylase/succinyl-diaminopimelate desuccinylase-like protein
MQRRRLLVDIHRRLEEMGRRPDVAAAITFVRETDEHTVATQVELCEIPAPPFGEALRGARVAELFGGAGLGRPALDAAGNVVAKRAGSRDDGLLVVSAHLDTVFPLDTDVSVRREGDLLRGPGISDDARGLATLVALARMLDAAKIRTRSPLLFAATVGEEGAGDLRGVKELFSERGRARDASGFISLDGAGTERIVVEGLGARRYLVSLRGPGGHSWVDWGTANPIHALSELGRALTSLDLRTDPRATLTLARIGGGKSINAIPQHAWLEIDTRSARSQDLDELEGAIRAVVARLGAEHEGLAFEVTITGDRPAGRTDPEAILVRAAVAATRAQHSEPVLALSSTDANVPMALGVPAVTLGCGGEAGQAHTTGEWYRNVRGPEGIIRVFHTILLAAGLAPDGSERGAISRRRRPPNDR